MFKKKVKLSETTRRLIELRGARKDSRLFVAKSNMTVFNPYQGVDVYLSQGDVVALPKGTQNQNLAMITDDSTELHHREMGEHK